MIGAAVDQHVLIVVDFPGLEIFNNEGIGAIQVVVHRLRVPVVEIACQGNAFTRLQDAFQVVVGKGDVKIQRGDGKLNAGLAVLRAPAELGGVGYRVFVTACVLGAKLKDGGTVGRYFSIPGDGVIGDIDSSMA